MNCFWLLYKLSKEKRSGLWRPILVFVTLVPPLIYTNLNTSLIFFFFFRYLSLFFFFIYKMSIQSTENSRISNSNIKHAPTIGIMVSSAALLHSYIYWVYSILYILYSKIATENQCIKPRKIRLKKRRVVHCAQKHAKKKKTPRVIAHPTTAHPPSPSVMVISQPRPSFVHSLKSLQSRVHQKIHARKIPAKTNPDDGLDRANSGRKRDRAKTFIRSTFQRNNSFHK